MSNPPDSSKDETPKDEPQVWENAWFYLLVGVLVMVIGLMFGLVAWRDYKEGGLEDAFFAMTIPIAMCLFFLIDRLEAKLNRQAWTTRWPRIWKTLKDVLPILVFIPFLVLADLDFSQPWLDLLVIFLKEFLLIFAAAFVVVFLFGLIKDWHRGKI